MEREDRYIVFKIKDVEELFTETEKGNLKTICTLYCYLRKAAGKEDISHVVVDSDWPEYEKVWQMIEERVDGE